MKRKLILVGPSSGDLTNVVFIGDSRLSNLEFKRVEKRKLKEEEKLRVACMETCTCIPKENGVFCEGNKTRCLIAVVKRTPEELEDKKKDLKRLYPFTKF